MGRRKTTKESQDGILVPTELPLLPLDGQVLLPTSYARISLSHKSVSSMSLISHLLRQQGSNVMIAVVPQLSAPNQQLRSPQPDRKQTEVADFSRLHALGTAARVLRLTRSAQSGNWVVELEGCCRVRVNSAHTSSSDDHDTATVEQLEQFQSSHDRQEDAELDAEGEAVLSQLRQAARQLLGMVSFTSGAAAAARLADMLEAAPPGRCADLLAAVLMPPPATRLAVLDAVDVRERLQLALSLVKDALKTARQAVGALGDSAAVAANAVSDDKAALAAQLAALRRLQAAQKGLQGSSMLPGGILQRRSRSGDGSEEENDLAELARCIEKADMPPHVQKVALRELKRLQRSSEQHPGYAVARTYLETLVDLPWNAFAAGPPARAQSASEAHQRPGSHTPQDQAAQQQAEAGDASVDAGNSQAAVDQPLVSSRNAAQTPVAGLSLPEAQALLDQHHYGLDKVKRRIIQYLAVRRLRGPDAKAPILAFVGPPGVGKTSLARSVAEALGGRPFQRISLGGVRDEAEIRGHRRTYIGAMMGRVMQAVRQAGVRDAVLLLDEIDKVSRDARGDPAAALLEILDPEQNHAFVDNYLALGFDLSKVVFLATANSLANVPAPLLDRLEVVHLSGYTLDEKVHIAERHLIPKLLQEHGLSGQQLQFPRAAVLAVARGYTREAGVRSLSRAIAAICRHICVRVVEASDGNAAAAAHHDDTLDADTPEMPAADAATERHLASSSGGGGSGNPICAVPTIPNDSLAAGSTRHVQLQQCVGVIEEATIDDTSHDGQPWQQVVVDEELIADVLGPPRYSWHDPMQRVAGAGSAAGLVWTAAGGQVQYVECIATGRGRSGHPGSLTLTGQMGEVLGESARIALSWIRAHASQLPLLPAGDLTAETAASASGGIKNRPDDAKADAADATSWDVHLHLPAGAVPKDGPSAGVTLAVALTSLFTGRQARGDTAITGELTLRGLVLPVGGIKEKLLAAHQAGLARVIIPERNMPDVKADLPAAVREVLQIIPVQRLEEVLTHAFDPPLVLQPRSRL